MNTSSRSYHSWNKSELSFPLHASEETYFTEISRWIDFHLFMSLIKLIWVNCVDYEKQPYRVHVSATITAKEKKTPVVGVSSPPCVV